MRSRLSDWMSRLRFAWARRRLDEEARQEIDAHLALLVARYVGQGLPCDEAYTAARRQFGNASVMRQQLYDMNSISWAEEVSQDLRYALRQLRHNPGFAATAIATLALAIGAHTAMFSVLNAVLLRPLPYASPEQLVTLWLDNPSQGRREVRPAWMNVDEWRRHSESFSEIVASDPLTATLTGAGGAERISVSRTTPNFLRVRGIEPLLGRSFSIKEAEARQRVAVISHRFWQTRFNGAPDVVGRSLEINGLTSEIIGVLPPEDGRIGDHDVWEPHTMFPDWEARRTAAGEGSWFVLARLRPSVTIDQARAEMNAIASRFDEQLPVAERGRTVGIVPLSRHLVGAQSRTGLWMLTGAVSCVLLIAAANIAGLSVARSVGRAREMSIRAAVGATSARIARQLVVESVTLAAIAGAVGTGLAVVGIGFVRAFGPGDLERLQDVSLDLGVLGWAVAISGLAGVLVGLAPALTTMRREAWSSGKEGSRGVAGGAAARRLRRSLVAAEVALAVVLLAGAGLLLRSWWHAERVDMGFQSERLLMVQVTATGFTAPEQRVHFYDRLIERVSTLPGVQYATVVSDLFATGVTNALVTVDGSARAASERLQFRRDEVSQDFFSTVDAPLLRGRAFSAADTMGSPLVTIVNDAMARRLSPEGDPVGTRFKIGPPEADTPWFTVIGVVGNMRRSRQVESEPIPQMFEAMSQNPPGTAQVLVRTTANEPLTLAQTVRTTVRDVDPRVPVGDAVTVDSHVGTFLAQRRFQTSLLMAFAAAALLLAAIGIYGLIQYSVVTRTHEIAIRMAVGAHAGEIFRLVVREGLALSAIGLAIGLAAALAASHAGAGLLFQVTATDPLTFVTIALALIAIAGAACYVPARRAMRVEPTAALRQG